MTRILALLITLPLVLGAVEEPKLPSSAQSILDKGEKEVAKNRSQYDDANRKTFEAIEKSLKAELEKFTKAGKLDEALAVKKAIEGFRADLLAKVEADATKGTGKKTSANTGCEAEVVKAIVGKTYLMNGDQKDPLTFLANGIMDLPTQWTNRAGAKWTYSDKFTVTIKATADTYTVKFSEDYRTYVCMRNGTSPESGVLSE